MELNNKGFNDPNDRANNNNSNKNQDTNTDKTKTKEQETAVADLEEVDPIEYYGL